MTAASTLRRFAKAWRGRVGGAARRVLLCAFAATLLLGAHLARLGTPAARSIAALGLVAVAATALSWWRRERRDWTNPERVIRRSVIPTDRLLGQRMLRALRLAEDTRQNPEQGSAELAELYFERQLALAPLEAVRARAEQRARAGRIAALGLLGVALAAIAAGPLRLLEGFNVWLAYAGRAPISMQWLDMVSVSIQVPTYLREPDHVVLFRGRTAQPTGSVVVVRGLPVWPGRALALSDGAREIPFVSDGAGGVVARWPLAGTAELGIVARFGEVVIAEDETLALEAVADRTPSVELEGAPSERELSELEALELRYQARDDHGLKQIDLVLRSGSRNDRRVLLRLDGEATVRPGGHTLSPADPFLKRAFLPVEVWIEARDADPISGPKWGRSAAIVLLPPTVGEPEAERLASLQGARDDLVDLLAEIVERADRAEPSIDERPRVKAVARTVDGRLEAVRGGLRVPKGLQAFVRGQLTQLERASEKARRTRLEEAVLALDAALGGLAAHDAREVSKRLGEVAEDIERAARQAGVTEQRSDGLRRLDLARAGLERGAEQLVRLGVLGRDLGSVAQGELRRLARARKAENLTHLEWIAHHLAERLRRPHPSFGSAARGGVESGSAGTGMPSEQPTQSDEHFDQLAIELENLARDHAREIARVSRALDDAEQQVELDELRQRAKQRADELRRALDDLPPVGARPNTARAAAALGREHGMATAGSMERLALRDAIESARAALNALDDAERKATSSDPPDRLDQDALRKAREHVADDLQFLEEALERLRQAARDRAQETLSEASKQEQELGRKAGNLAGRGRHSDAALPDDVVDSLERAEGIMQQAARELSEGSAEKGLELQQEAQRLLERADTGTTTASDDGDPMSQGGKGRGDGRGHSMSGDVPDAEERNKADDFRRRVLEGLGKGQDGRMAPAVKRYAEGLLQ